jgi:hypothetical protein
MTAPRFLTSSDEAVKLLDTTNTNGELTIPDRGRLFSVEDVQALLPVSYSIRWIKERVAPGKKIMLGQDAFWWEYDVRDWLDSLRGQRSPKSRDHLRKDSPMRNSIENIVNAKRRRAAQERAGERHDK